MQVFSLLLQFSASGDFPLNGVPAQSANPYTGALVKVNSHGTVTEIATELNLPASLEIIGDTAYVISLDGSIWAVLIAKDQPWGNSH